MTLWKKLNEVISESDTVTHVLTFIWRFHKAFASSSLKPLAVVLTSATKHGFSED